MPSTSIINRLRGERSTLVDRFAEAIVVEGGRRDGSAETRVTIDLRHPELADDGGSGGPERWRFRTARHRLARAPFSRDVLAAFHDAEAQKGRRLTAVDLRNQNRVAALMAWHFEPRTRQGGSRRPHLVTALSMAHEAAGERATRAPTTSWRRDVGRSPLPAWRSAPAGPREARPRSGRGARRGAPATSRRSARSRR